MKNGGEDFGSEIVRLVYATYDSLKIGGKPQGHEWTVLSAVVEERDGSNQVIV